MSRLDRFLISEEWLNEWQNPLQWILNRDVSDHCPIVLRCNSSDWGPKPFKFNNCCLLHDNFHNMVEQMWVSLEVSEWKAFVLKEKLKLLKSFLRTWNKEHFGELDSSINSIKEGINNLDLKAEDQGLSEEEVEERKRLFDEF